ncbi:PhzF family phenazine biosynthesis protein [uncultured Paraglaciecola sp.]|uniref:PhzF family phenazine biosynthesis protein n=1 Tax=uncultured Paraglaciecola sp. TaxID=1765024 RepID=UPI0030DD6E0C|tara:strand:- start:17044 stop:17823 length:780 start_codon:yes stop_codon:yes gene_type:complete
MQIDLFQVDAFAEQVFTGNPAAVCPLDAWIADDLLQKIAQANNLSETAFFVPCGAKYELRWFTPSHEVDLCGHATLAVAHVLFTHLAYQQPQICFTTKSGELLVTKTSDGLTMDFPASMPKAVVAPDNLLLGLGATPKAVLAAFDYIIELEDEQGVSSVIPDLALWKTLDLRGVVVTARGTDVDFVSRCFFPGLNVDEDPVTGSAHCELAPYWSQKLTKDNLKAKQLSPRTGLVECQLSGERVLLTGKTVDYMRGRITL